VPEAVGSPANRRPGGRVSVTDNQGGLPVLSRPEVQPTLESFSPRLPPAAAGLVWFAWLAVAAALTWPLAWAPLVHARRAHPDLFALFAGGLAVAALAGPLLYQRLRRGGWWRWELRLFAAAGIAVPLFYEPRATVVTLWLAAVMAGTGSWVLGRLRLEPAGACRRLVFSFAFGFAVLVWPLTALAMAGWFRPGALVLLLAGGTVLVGVERRRLLDTLRGLDRAWRSDAALGGPFSGWFVPAGWVLLLAGLAVSLAPSIAFDPLRFHLPLAQLYAETGRLAALPGDSYGYNPQSFELVLGLGWSLGGQAAAQLVPLVFFVAFLAALWAVVRAAGLERSAAFGGWVLAGATPFLHWTGGQVKHDLLVGFLHLAALLAWFEWRSCGNLRWILAGLIFGAASLGCKYPAAVGLIGLAPLYLWAAWKERRKWPALAGYAAAALLIAAFWPLRAWWFGGDPFAGVNPAGPLVRVQDHIGTDLFPWLARKLSWPWRIHFDGRRFFHAPTDYPMGAALVVLVPLWLLWKPKAAAPGMRACLVFAWAALIPWAFYIPLLRFVAAPVAILIVLSAARAGAWFSRAGAAVRASLAAAVAWCLFVSMSTIAFLEINGPQLSYFSGAIGKREYLRRALRTYRSLEALQGMAGSGDAVLGVRNCSRLYAPYPDRYYCRYWDPESPEDRRRLARVLVDWNVRYAILPAASARPAVLDEIAGGARWEPVYRGPHFCAYRLR